jgi:hypothetical protein
MQRYRASAEALVAAPHKDGDFRAAEDLVRRVPSPGKKGLTRLAQVDALNWLDGIEHPRDALWQVEHAGENRRHTTYPPHDSGGPSRHPKIPNRKTSR